MAIKGLITPQKSIEMPNQSGIPLQWTFDHLDEVLRKFGVERNSFQTPLLVNDKDSTGSLAKDMTVINQTADPSVRFRALVKKPFLIGRNKVPQVSSIGGHLDTLYIAPNTHPSLKDELTQIAEFKDFKLVRSGASFYN